MTLTLDAAKTPATAVSAEPIEHPGLEGVVAAATKLSRVDGAAGRLKKALRRGGNAGDAAERPDVEQEQHERQRPGEHALRAIGDAVRESGLEVSALYASNVEFYLWSDGSFPTFAENVRSLPLADDGVLIRSYFGGGGFQDPLLATAPGYYSAQLLQPFSVFLEAGRTGGFRGYRDLVTRGALPLGAR